MVGVSLKGTLTVWWGHMGAKKGKIVQLIFANYFSQPLCAPRIQKIERSSDGLPKLQFFIDLIPLLCEGWTPKRKMFIAVSWIQISH